LYGSSNNIRLTESKKKHEEVACIPHGLEEKTEKDEASWK